MANSLEKRKYFFIYKTTNLINEKYYIGMHSTSNLKDGYLGSGTYLRRSIRKYGKENFKCEILEFCETYEKLIKREKELVHKELIKDSLCMNLKPGGLGGSGSGVLNGMFGKKVSEKSKSLISINRKKWNLDNPLKFAANKKKSKEALRKKVLLGEYNHAAFKNKKHTEETKLKMSKSKKETTKGNGNSQYGTCWITNGIINKKIKKEKAVPPNWKLGRILKKL